MTRHRRVKPCCPYHSYYMAYFLVSWVPVAAFSFENQVKKSWRRYSTVNSTEIFSIQESASAQGCKNLFFKKYYIWKLNVVKVSFRSTYISRSSSGSCSWPTVQWQGCYRSAMVWQHGLALPCLLMEIPTVFSGWGIFRTLTICCGCTLVEMFLS